LRVSSIYRADSWLPTRTGFRQFIHQPLDNQRVLRAELTATREDPQPRIVQAGIYALHEELDGTRCELVQEVSAAEIAVVEAQAEPLMERAVGG